MAQFAYDYNPAKTCSYLNNRIEEDNFHAWGKDNMYRTSYISMYKDKPNEPQNSVIPGYAGFIPGFKSKDEFGKTFAKAAKDSLNHPTLGQNRFRLSSTGFNVTKHDFKDPSLIATSHKYGCQNIKTTHPSLWGEKKISQTHDTYRGPLTLIPPTYRPGPVDVVNPSESTKTSGFGTNSITFDGRGLVNHREYALDRTNTEYRIRYNSEKPYHPNTTSFHIRKLNTIKNGLNIVG